MGSERLPGKILKSIHLQNGDIPLLQFAIERLKTIPSKPDVILATTVNNSDDPTEKLGKQLGIRVFRGSETDVLERYYKAASATKADIVLRVTGDCPLIDPDICEQAIQEIIKTDADYVSNVLVRTYPRGLDVEAIQFSILEKLYRDVHDPRYREHVTLYIYEHQNEFKVKNFKFEKDLSYHRWTVDHSEDFELIQRIISSLYPKNPKFRMGDVIALLSEHPDWLEINSHIEQKKT